MPQQTLDVEEFEKIRAAGGCVVIDVREPQEYAKERLPGSINLPLSQIDSWAPLIPKDRSLAMHCLSGKRSQKAAVLLEEKGFTRTVCLSGGLGAWKSAGFKTERVGPRIPLEGQIRIIAGLMVLAGLIASRFWPPAVVLAYFVPTMLIIAGITNSCLMGIFLKKLPWNQ